MVISKLLRVNLFQITKGAISTYALKKTCPAVELICSDAGETSFFKFDGWQISINGQGRLLRMC